MSTKEDQPTLLVRIRALSATIADYRRRFALPKGHRDRYETHGAAQGFQRAQRERSALQGKLEPFQVIARGISCRDCVRFEHDDRDRLICRRWPRLEYPTAYARQNDDICGPSALHFKPVAAHA